LRPPAPLIRRLVLHRGPQTLLPLAQWIYKRGSPTPLLAVSDRHSPAIHIFHADRLGAGAVHVIGALHTAPVTALAYNEPAHAVISGDARGVLEYWSASPEADFAPPTATAAAAATAIGAAAAPASATGAAAMVSFAFKSDTSLFDLAKARAAPTAMAVAPDGAHFAVAASDAKVRLFAFRSGRVTRVYDEGLAVYEAAHARAVAATAAAASAGDGGGTAVAAASVEVPEFAKRAAAERDLQATAAAALKLYASKPAAAATAATAAGAAEGNGVGTAAGAGAGKDKAPYRPPPSNVVFDESGNFLVYASLAGIKVINTTNNKARVARRLPRLPGSHRPA